MTTEWQQLVIGDVDVDKAQSPWGRVKVYNKGKAKETRRWVFFHSLAEFQSFWLIWCKLEKPFVILYRATAEGGEWKKAR